MYSIPLFPLDTVLFPGMPIHLHIFEPRYQLMMRRCIDQQQPFGVVLIHEGLEAGGDLAKPHAIGCTARIVEIERLAEGRMNLTAIGDERFHLHETLHDEPYLIGRVEHFPLEQPETIQNVRTRRLLVTYLRHYLRLLQQTGLPDMSLRGIELPEESLLLLYLAAALLQIPGFEKQQLLALPAAPQMLGQVLRLYRRENAVIARLKHVTQQEAEKQAWLN